METNFMNLVITIAVIAFGLIVTVAFLLNLKRKKEAEPTPVRKEDGTTKVDTVKRELLSLNIFVRENILSTSVVSKFEEVIDLVNDVAIPANEEKNYSPQTVIVNKMSKDYLPTVMHNYMLIENKENAEQTILNILEKIKEQLILIKASYNNANQEVFERNTRIMESIFDSYNAKS